MFLHVNKVKLLFLSCGEAPLRKGHTRQNLALNNCILPIVSTSQKGLLGNYIIKTFSLEL